MLVITSVGRMLDDRKLGTVVVNKLTKSSMRSSQLFSLSKISWIYYHGMQRFNSLFTKAH